jgi:hypothetical protein
LRGSECDPRYRADLVQEFVNRLTDALKPSCLGYCQIRTGDVPGLGCDLGGVGPRRTGCISCGNCCIGCGHNAKNNLTTNYLYLAEKLGAEIHELHEVYDLLPLDGGGFEVHARALLIGVPLQHNCLNTYDPGAARSRISILGKLKF